MTKDMLLPRVALSFQQKGITCLLYDPRSIGSSDGTPRNDINPATQVADYHDALTFLRSDDRIDSRRIAYWGFSFSGTVALSAAALDQRASAVLAVCPLTAWDFDMQIRPGVLLKTMQDRESQISGNPPFCIPMITDDGHNPAGFSPGLGANELSLVTDAIERIPGFNLDTTIQTYYNIMAWDPFKMLRYLDSTPVLIIAPENDKISPVTEQKELIYDKISGPKEFHLIPGKGHMDVLDGDSFGVVVDAQVAFIRHHLGNRQ